MALFKCKMCGGSLEIASGTTVIECEYCGTKQTLPKLDDDKRANMYDRANHFRRNNEFDKAMGIYEQILNEDNTDAEAYWSLVLCRYGIEYVEDPSSHKRIPTVNRTQFTSVLADEDYKSALANSDTYQKSIYEIEAKAIDEIQKGILTISQKEEPFDVFICYKETDRNGRRTPDSVLAQELYFGLKSEGFKVFFSRITLEDKLGSAYEPYIFAALNSAKVMVVLGTKPEFFNAVWVKNEWSRYLALIKQGQQKMLIPAYKDMDPYDLPEEFSHLQAQDMSKLGFMQDLIRGIKKIIKPKPTVIEGTIVATPTNTNVAPLLKRASMFLEDGDFVKAEEFYEKVLNQDPECAQAYLGKLMAELHVKNQDDLNDCAKPFDEHYNYQKALRFANDSLKTVLVGYIEHINTRNENARLEDTYQKAVTAMNCAKNESEFRKAAQLFDSICAYKDSTERSARCLEKAEAVCLERERKAEIDRKEAKKQFKRNAIIYCITILTICAVIAVVIWVSTAIRKNSYYENGEYGKLVIEFGMTDFVIPEGVTVIEDRAFAYCSTLKSITIPKSVTKIGNNAFFGCTNLTSVNIPDSVTSIGAGAFNGCSSLTSITLPFVGASINQKTDNTSFGYIFGPSFSSLYGNDCVPVSLKTVVITSDTSIADCAFYGCSSLTSITIHDTVTSIGYRAFYGCSSLESITLPFVGATKDGTSNTYFGYIFGNRSSTSTDENIPASLKSVVITGGATNVTSIASNAFYKCSSLTSITLPEKVTSIGNFAFSECTNLTSITIPDGVKTIGLCALSSCPRLTNIIIPDSITTIDAHAFRVCTSLTSITFQGTVAQWNAIDFGANWKEFVPATEVVCSDGTVTLN